MSFKKLYKVVPDEGLGFQTLNQAADNNAEMRIQMFVEHGDREPGVFRSVAAPMGLTRPPVLPDYARIGRHDLVEIPRTVSNLSLYLTPSLSVGTQLGWSGVGVDSIWRIGVGEYLAHVVGLSSFWAIPCGLVGASVTSLTPQIRPFYPSASNNNNAGLWISTYALSGGAFVAADSVFTFALYGEK